jgi:hypothetical protein
MQFISLGSAAAWLLFGAPRAERARRGICILSAKSVQRKDAETQRRKTELLQAYRRSG